MAQRFELKTFKDLQDAVREELEIPSSDTTLINRIKRDLNIVYLTEVMPYHDWTWQRDTIHVQMDPYINAGTVSVTQGSVDITFSVAPATSQKGRYFQVDGDRDFYRIAEHTAGSTSAKLDVRYIEATASAQNYKLFSKSIQLPSDLEDTFEVRHQFRSTPLTGVGIQEYRRLEASGPLFESRPAYYCTTDKKETEPYSTIDSLPSVQTRASSGLAKRIVFASSLRTNSTDETTRLLKPGDKIDVSGAGNFTYNGEFVVADIETTTNTDDTIVYVAQTPLSESATSDGSLVLKKKNIEGSWEGGKELLIYPYLFDTRTNIEVDYLIQPELMVEDSDEPIIPYSDRIVLLFGALARSWVKQRNSQTAVLNESKFQARLTRMSGKDGGDSKDNVIIQPSKAYLSAKRSIIARQSHRKAGLYEFGGAGGGGGQQTISGTANTVAIFNSSGELIGSTTVSTTELNKLDGILSSTVGITDTQTLTNKTIDADNNTISNLAHGSEVDNPSSGVHGVAGNVVGTSDAQTLTNKTIDADNNTITNIDNDEIKAAAAIDVNKLAALTASRVVVSNGSGFISADDITPTELGYLNDVVPLTQVALNDNQVSAANIFTYSASSFESSVIEYSISRGSGNREVGRLMVATDGTSVNMSQDQNILGTIGVTLSADISGGNVRIRYTSTSTGTAPTFNYIQRRWT